MLGIEPAANVAAVAVEMGVPSLVKFFGTVTARELVAQGKRPDLLLGNNVLAQVPRGSAEMVAAAIRTVFAQPGPVHVAEQLDTIATMLGRQFPKVERMLRDAADSIAGAY